MKKMSKKEQIEKSLEKAITEFKIDNPSVKYVEYDDLYYTYNGTDYYVPKYNHWSGSNSYDAKVCHDFLKKNHHIIRNKGILPHIHANHNIIELT